MITLYRSNNAPIIFDFDTDTEQIQEIEISLFSDNNYTKLVQKWTKDDVIFKDNYLIIPLTQQESKNFPTGIGHLDLKWLNTSGFIVFTETQSIIIKSISNLNILGDDDLIDYNNIEMEDLLSTEFLNKYHIAFITLNKNTDNTWEETQEDSEKN